MTEKDNGSPALTAVEVENALQAELGKCTLVGEVDLEHWGPLAEEQLASLTRLRPPASIGTSSPALLVAYLCWQGRHNYNEGAFWPNVTIPALQVNTEVGPAFDRALRSLGLPTFDDLEELEGITMTKRYVRRVHLHGGLPRSSVPRLLDLLAATLRSSAATPDEVVDTWLSTGVGQYGLDKPSERLVLYTGDFGLGIIAGYIELLRAQGRRDVDADNLALPPYLVEAFYEWLPTHDPSKYSWMFVAGPKVELDRFGSSGPHVRVPRGDTDWFCGSQFLGSSARGEERVFALDPSTEWMIAAKDKRPIRLMSLDGRSGVWLFDERGRAHRGGTLCGASAFVVGPAGVDASGCIDRRPLSGQWNGHDLLSVDLRGRETLDVVAANGETLEPVLVDSSWGVRLGGDVVGGLTTPDGAQVVGTRLTLKPAPGYFPDPAEISVVVSASGAAVQAPLDRLPQSEHEYDLTDLVDQLATGAMRIEVCPTGGDPAVLEAIRLPGLRVDLPLLAAPADEVLAAVAGVEGVELPDQIRIAPETSSTRVACGLADGTMLELVAQVERCLWEVRNADAIVPDFGGDRFVVRPDEMRGGVLEILCADPTRLRLWLQDREGRRLQRLRLRRRHHESSSVEVRLDSALDTATGSSHRLFDLVLYADDGRSVILGHVQTGPSAEELRIATKEGKKRTKLAVSWHEPRPWPNRVVRLWERDGTAPLAEVPVPDDATSAKVKVDKTTGAHLLEIGAAATGWTKPKRPEPGPVCTTVFLGRGAQELIDAVRQANARITFADDDVADLPDLLADLWVRGIDSQALSEAQRNVVTSLAFDEPRRLVCFVSMLLGNGDHAPSNAERVSLMRLLFDCPVRDAGAETADALSTVWDADVLIGACLDADLSNDSWNAHASWTWNPNCSVGSGLDALLFGLLAAPEVDGREISVRGASYVPSPLTAHNWFELTRHRPSNLGEPLARWVNTWPGPDEVVRGPVWAGLMNRLRSLQLQNRDERMDDLVRAVIGAACTSLDPVASAESAGRAEGVLVSALEQIPALAEACILTAVAAMRVLENAPGWNRSIT
jgi:hypothetical protein